MILRCALIVACVGGAVSADVQEVPGSMEFTGRVIAQPIKVEAMVANGVARAQAQTRVAQANAMLATFEVYTTEPLVGYTAIVVPKGENENQVIDRLMATGLFEYVEPDWMLYPLACPDDSRFSSQWHHDTNHLESCAGWDIETGNPSVTVGICDTGIQTSHPDFQLHRKEGYNAVDRVWESAGGQITPVHPHGTMTTGCAAANGNDGNGVTGIGWNLSHRMMRVSNSSSGGSSLTTLNHASLTSIQAGDRVASVSYSGVSSASIRSTATTIKGLNGLLVWAAGNDGANLNWGNRDNDDLIVAGATNINDQRAGFSAFGNSVDVMAPGDNVFTTTTGSGYANVSGTSFACPLTAGLAALIWSANPSLTPDEVEFALKNGADDLGAAGPDTTYGYGRINVLGSLLLAGDPAVDFAFPAGLPETIDPNGGTTANVTIATNGTSIQGSPTLFYDDGSGFQSVALTSLGGSDFQIPFPAVTCEATVEYYISVDTTDGDTSTSPSGAPATSYNALAVTGITDVVVENFEADNGWTTDNTSITGGAWERGTPAGLGDRGDPTVDSDGSGACWLTENGAGNTDVDGGPTILISDTFDLSAQPGAVISYDYWFTNNNGDGDAMTVAVSDNNGASWTTVASHGAVSDWTEASFVVSDFVNTTSTVRFRFSVSDNPNDSVTEAGLDNFRIQRYECGGYTVDLNGDGVADFFDIQEFLNLYSAQDTQADWNSDGVFDFFDVQAFLADFAVGC
jgi:subtilisin family serine protease